MILILGGAYQGKTDYAKQCFCLSDADIFTCHDRQLDADCRCLSHLERYTLACVQAGLDPAEVTDFEALQDKILLCDDISCGVVPIDAQTRAWREQTGRFLVQLSTRAQSVVRIFCGLPLTLKP